MIYLDSCALIKLLVEEPESAALDRYLAEQIRQGIALLSSELSQVGAHRALIRRKADREVHAQADELLADCARRLGRAAAEIGLPVRTPGLVAVG